MRDSAAAAWAARTDRERRLLLVMFAMIGIVLAWLLVVRPLADALADARRDHGEAVLALAEARARADAAGRLRGDPRASAPRPIDAFVARTAAEAGFADARIQGRGPERATIAIEAARPQAFFGWVRAMEQAGLAVETLSARANGDRTLSVDAAFRARGG